MGACYGCGGYLAIDPYGHGHGHDHGYLACHAAPGPVAFGATAPATPGVVEPSREVLPVPTPSNQSSASEAATVVIKAPTDVRITVDGQETNRQTAETAFRTPELRAGQTYSYHFKAETVRNGRPVSEVKKVLVRAGEQSVVDFGSLAGPEVEGPRVALVTFEVPEDAKVWVEGIRWHLTREQRTFTTPALKEGKNYFYEVKAEVTRGGKLQTEQRTVAVSPGQHIKVEFKNLAPIQTASR